MVESSEKDLGDGKTQQTQPEVRAQFSEPPLIGLADSKSPNVEEVGSGVEKNQVLNVAAKSLIVEAKILSESSIENVEMTDENASKSDAAASDSLEISNQSSSLITSNKKEVEDSKKIKDAAKVNIEHTDKHPIDNFEFEKLLRQNNGQDVHLEFYLNGVLVPPETSFFEIWQMA